MATTRSFSAMLNEYLPNKLLKEELLKRDWLLTNIEKDDNWMGSKVIVPFKAAGSSLVGSLQPAAPDRASAGERRSTPALRTARAAR